MDTRLFSFYRIYVKTLKNHKIDTSLSVANIIVNQIISIIFLYVIFQSVPALGGWDSHTLVFMYGLFIFNKGIAAFFTTSLYSIEGHVRDGSFDGMMVRPISPIIQILGEQFEMGELVNVTIGICILLVMIKRYCVCNACIAVAFILMFAIISVLLVFAIRLICMSVSFWTLTSYPIAIVIDNFSDFAKYPITIYNSMMKIVLEYIIPFSALAYFPTLVILENRIEVLFISLLVVVVMFILAIFIWNKGLKNYQSCGH